MFAFTWGLHAGHDHDILYRRGKIRGRGVIVTGKAEQVGGAPDIQQSNLINSIDILSSTANGRKLRRSIHASVQWVHKKIPFLTQDFDICLLEVPPHLLILLTSGVVV